MKISVVIPTYNSSAFIQNSLQSVFRQSRPADEVLVLDDGSQDETTAILNSCKPKLTVFQQTNQGVAVARNELCKRASGDLIGFLDHDDIWHPDYLAVQQDNFARHPQAGAFFTGHENFKGYGDYEWTKDPGIVADAAETITPVDFLRRYHNAPGPFASMSYCCIPKSVLDRLGPAPFHPELSGVDDYYVLHTLLLLGGPIVYDSRPMVAYRITPGAQSASLLKAVKRAVYALELLEPQFDQKAGVALGKAFRAAFSAQRREYGRILMGSSQVEEARRQFRGSLAYGLMPESWVKSLALLLLTRVPSRLQPKWPAERKLSHSL